MTLIVSHAPDSYLNPVRLNTHTCPISDAVSLRVYSSTEPHNSKIAYLQKGLILVIGGAEAVGEGAGEEVALPGAAAVPTRAAAASTQTACSPAPRARQGG